MSNHSLLGILSCLTCLFLSACQEKTLNGDLFPQTENMTWHYNASFRAGRVYSHHKMVITNKNTEFEGEKVISHQFHNGDIAYYGKNENGVFRIAFYSSSDGLVKDPDDHFLIHFPLAAGTKWKIRSKPFFLEQSVRKINSGQASLSADLKINPLFMEYKISAVNEKITVSAGKYSHCVRITGTGETTANGPEIGSTKISVVQTDWYAPGVGLIKSERQEVTDLDWAKSSTYTMELDKIY